MRLVGVLWTCKPVPAFGAWKQGIKCFLSPWVACKTCIVLLDYRFGDFDSLPFGTRRRLQSKSFSVGSSVVYCSIVSFVLQWELSVVNTSDIVMSSGNILIKSWEVLICSLDVVSFHITTTKKCFLHSVYFCHFSFRQLYCKYSLTFFFLNLFLFFLFGMLYLKVDTSQFLGILF